MRFAADVDAAERWKRREERFEHVPWSRINNRLDRIQQRDWYVMTPEQKSAARIQQFKDRLKYDRYNTFLKKRLKRLERLHGQRTLLGWEWLNEHPEHPLSPAHQDWLKYGIKAPL